MADQTPDLTSFENLPIYEVAQLIEAETSTPLVAWLHLMIKGKLLVCFEEHPKGPHFVEQTCKVLNKFDAPPKSVSEDKFSERVINLGQIINKRNPGPKEFIIPLKDQIDCAYINREYFRAWCESQEYPLPKFWFGDIAQTGQTPAEKRKRLDESTRQQAEEYALQERKRGTPEPEIVLHIQDTYGFRGVKLHDIIWPEKKEIEPSTKNVNLTRMRNKARDK